MKKSVMKKWVAALRSGKYKQGKKGYLQTNEGFCCLGVLCEISGVAVKSRSNGCVYFDEKFTELPNSVMKWSGMRSAYGEFLNINERLSSLNDIGLFEGSSFPNERYTFEELADIIEMEYENL